MDREAARDRLFLAIDTADLGEAQRLAGLAAGRVGGLKLGLEFFCAHGQPGVRRLARGQRLFLDLKLHDIPATVAGAVAAVAPLGPFLVTVHAAGGAAMMKAAADAARRAGAGRAKLVAVTALTSLDAEDVGAADPASLGRRVERLAMRALQCGMDGVVCSAREAGRVRRRCGADFLIVVPGIRPPGSGDDDHKRPARPAEAIAAGADYLVVGRPIAAAGDPAAAADAIVAAMAAPA